MTTDEPPFYWWIERDDGEVVEGPFMTEAEAKNQLHALYDESEYRVTGPWRH